jgi:hypothetical protein
MQGSRHSVRICSRKKLAGKQAGQVDRQVGNRQQAAGRQAFRCDRYSVEEGSVLVLALVLKCESTESTRWEARRMAFRVHLHHTFTYTYSPIHLFTYSHIHTFTHSRHPSIHPSNNSQQRSSAADPCSVARSVAVAHLLTCPLFTIFNLQAR